MIFFNDSERQLAKLMVSNPREIKFKIIFESDRSMPYDKYLKDKKSNCLNKLIDSKQLCVHMFCPE